ncbi:unnamed protein product [Didymodactylos carnosus]|uniref:Uncharacterized protein n=2 Tax=Didymodactylos carnosus TaxID=1234261 RepID=A0A814GMS8_9BILA|nr:unnamed protein product [Didymodactylos carnosus]CAF3770150.1 unnamed protein product [Didymodactylos carnosus]
MIVNYNPDHIVPQHLLQNPSYAHLINEIKFPLSKALIDRCLSKFKYVKSITWYNYNRLHVVHLMKYSPKIFRFIPRKFNLVKIIYLANSSITIDNQLSKLDQYLSDLYTPKMKIEHLLSIRIHRDLILNVNETDIKEILIEKLIFLETNIIEIQNYINDNSDNRKQ